MHINYLCVENSDYKIERYTVDFTADGRSRTIDSDPFVIEPIDDDQVEADESFELRIMNGSLPSYGLDRVIATYPAFVRFIITNDDGKSFTV